DVGMQMQRPLVSGRENHRAQREMARLDDARIIVAPRPAPADVSHLRTAILRVDLRLKIQYAPIRLTIFETRNVSVDVINRRNWMAHGSPSAAQPRSGSPLMAARKSSEGGAETPQRSIDSGLLGQTLA